MIETRTKVTTLPNGLVVLTDPMPWVASAFVGVWVDVGSRDEDLGSSGISHMLEHMAFKGTTRRSARELSEVIEDVGGALNAHTGRDMTAYHVSTLGEHVPFAVDVLADILTRPTYDEGELEKEKRVVLQELAQSHDDPLSRALDLLMSTSFGDHPLGRSILGDEASVRGMTREAIVRYVEAGYDTRSMLLVASGAVDHDVVLELAERHFAELGDMRRGRLADRRTPALRRSGCLSKFAMPIGQAHLVLGFAGPSTVSEDLFVCQLFTTMLGGGASSRLFQRAREELALCYSIHAFADLARMRSEDGVLGIYAATEPHRVDELHALIIQEMRAIATHGVSDRELLRARAQIRSTILTVFESPSARAQLLAAYFLSHRRLPALQEILARYDAVDVAAVSVYAEQFLASTPNVVVVGPETVASGASS